MFLIDMIEPIYFFISLFIGFLLTYVFTPKPKLVIQFPTIHNTGRITYKDDSGSCYKYRHVRITCPKNKKKIKSHVIQQNK